MKLTTELTSELLGYEVRVRDRSDNDTLVCTGCELQVTEVEVGDTLYALVAMAAEHQCPPYRYTATFTPQVWVNDDAMDIDPRGPGSWDCTQAVIDNWDYFEGLFERHPHEVLDRDDVVAEVTDYMPEWVLAHINNDQPFSIHVERVKRGE